MLVIELWTEKKERNFRERRYDVLFLCFSDSLLLFQASSRGCLLIKRQLYNFSFDFTLNVIFGLML